MQKLSDLAVRPDFRIGPLSVSPSRRQVAGPGGQVSLEPQIMQVLLLLLDARGKVVTRTTLFDEIWAGAIVGDDSLNRAVARVRRIDAEVGPGLFEIETIPRTGYRLLGKGLTAAAEPAVALNRRHALAGGLGAIALTAGTGFYFLSGKTATDEIDALVERGHQIIRESVPGNEQKAVALLLRAVELDPNNSKAWGLLALAFRDRVENGTPQIVTPALQECERAARRALSLNPNNGNALTALATLQPEFGNWRAVERQLRAALAKDPDCVAALNSLTLVLQSVGRAEESFQLNEKAARLDPLDVTPQYRLAIKSWIFGRIDEADLVLNRGLQVWPNHPALWNTRLMVLAYSGRPDEGLHYLDRSLRSNPEFARSASLWKMTLGALRSDDPAVRATARYGLKQRAAKSSGASAHAIMSLSNLGFVEDAFEAANGYYRWRGKMAGAEKTAPRETLINDHSWRRTMLLFTPATRAMRLDPRFGDLTKAIGMADYWRKSGIGPDAFLFQA